MENSRIYHQIYDPIPYLLIENTFNQQEMELIWEELEFLNQPGKLMPPDQTKTAKSSDGEILNNNKGIFLDDLFSYNHNFSNILSLSNRLISKEVKVEFSRLNFGYNAIWQTNSHRTLINYYENGDYYRSHTDNALYSAITIFYKEPKEFSGGNFWISRFDHKIEIKNNMTILFPSFVEYHVDEVKMEEPSKGRGRYSISMFLCMEENLQ